MVIKQIAIGARRDTCATKKIEVALIVSTEPALGEQGWLNRIQGKIVVSIQLYTRSDRPLMCRCVVQ